MARDGSNMLSVALLQRLTAAINRTTNQDKSHVTRSFIRVQPSNGPPFGCLSRTTASETISQFITLRRSVFTCSIYLLTYDKTDEYLLYQLPIIVLWGDCCPLTAVEGAWRWPYIAVKLCRSVQCLTCQSWSHKWRIREKVICWCEIGQSIAYWPAANKF